MTCFIANCNARLNAWTVVAEVGGMFCCRHHIHEVQLDHLGEPPHRSSMGRPRPEIPGSVD